MKIGREKLGKAAHIGRAENERSYCVPHDVPTESTNSIAIDIKNDNGEEEEKEKDHVGIEAVYEMDSLQEDGEYDSRREKPSRRHTCNGSGYSSVVTSDGSLRRDESIRTTGGVRSVPSESGVHNCTTSRRREMDVDLEPELTIVSEDPFPFVDVNVQRVVEGKDQKDTATYTCPSPPRVQYQSDSNGILPPAVECPITVPEDCSHAIRIHPPRNSCSTSYVAGPLPVLRPLLPSYSIRSPREDHH